MKIIGLSGYARSGKDEAAKVLIEEFGFIRIGFADKLREAVYELNPLVSQYVYIKSPATGKISLWGGNEKVTVQHVIDQFGWDGYKETPYKDEVRRLLQRMGTEVGRNLLDDNIWVDSAFNGLADDAKVVVTDCRFPNEAEAVAKRGGDMWRIMRAGVEAINDHPSETSLDNWSFDSYIHNDGSLEDLHKSVKRRYLERCGV